jgi:hypothetical protein
MDGLDWLDRGQKAEGWPVSGPRYVPGVKYIFPKSVFCGK